MELVVGQTYKGVESSSTYKDYTFTVTELKGNQVAGIWTYKNGETSVQKPVHDSFKEYLEPMNKIPEVKEKDLWVL